jgi:hypothetical protein
MMKMAARSGHPSATIRSMMAERRMVGRLGTAPESRKIDRPHTKGTSTMTSEQIAGKRIRGIPIILESWSISTKRTCMIIPRIVSEGNTAYRPMGTVSPLLSWTMAVQLITTHHRPIPPRLKPLTTHSNRGLRPLDPQSPLLKPLESSSPLRDHSPKPPELNHTDMAIYTMATTIQERQRGQQRSSKMAPRHRTLIQ